MRGFQVISALICTMMLSSVASAQVKIVSGDRLREVNSPRLSADSASLCFETTFIHDASMSEEDSPVTYRYPFVNVGQHPVTISSVRTTCTCATAFCDKTEVGKGERGVISVRYDPKGHPGKFERKIFVYTDGCSAPSAILKLGVEVSSADTLAHEYPVQMGKIRLRRGEVSFCVGSGAVEKIRFVNVSDRPLTLRCEDLFLPDCIGFEARPVTVDPKSEGEIIISYEPSQEIGNKPVRLMLKGLGVPPSQSVIKITFE